MGEAPTEFNFFYFERKLYWYEEIKAYFLKNLLSQTILATCRHLLSWCNRMSSTFFVGRFFKNVWALFWGLWCTIKLWRCFVEVLNAGKWIMCGQKNDRHFSSAAHNFHLLWQWCIRCFSLWGLVFHFWIIVKHPGFVNRNDIVQKFRSSGIKVL